MVLYIILEPTQKEKVLVKLVFYYVNDRVGLSFVDNVPKAMMAFGSVLWDVIKTPHHGASASFLLQRVTAALHIFLIWQGDLLPC